jgi:purine-binding chemotaxis protein CheW
MTAVQVLLLPVGNDWYALPMEWVREVVAAPRLTRLVTAPSMVLGLFNLRGQIVALLDTAALLGLGSVRTTSFAVVVNGPQGLAGLATTGLPQRGVLGTPIGPSELPGTAGLYRVDQQVSTLLDPTTLLTPDRVNGSGSRHDLSAVRPS